MEARGVIAVLINTAWYLLYFAGLGLIFSGTAAGLWRRFELRHRLQSAGKRGAAKSDGLRYLRGILEASFVHARSRAFFLLSVAAVFLLTLLLASRSFRLPMALAMALFAGAFPVFFLMLRLEFARNRASREGISLVTELHRQYRMHGRSMLEAMEQTVAAGGDYPLCRRAMTRLLLRMRTSGGGELREAADVFAFSVGTTWAKMLAVCIRISAEKGDDVTEGLLDIARQLKEAAQREEKRKRLNSEAMRMTVFLVPLLYVCTILIAVYFLDTDLVTLMRNQFLTPEGFLLFLGTAVLFAFNLIILRLVALSRMDY